MTERQAASTPPLVILDRDGVINHDSDDHIKSPDEWQPIAGSLEAITQLHHEGWRIFVATNQSGLARGLSEMGSQVDGIFFCPHGPDAGCRCRKPATGLLEDIATRLNQSLAGVPLIGDSHRDLAAAAAVGARPMLVLTGKGHGTLSAHQSGAKALPPGTSVFKDLAHAVSHLLHQTPALPGP
jgi:D-glycero-D-manno-heptose 1,7-bisphosphate phosphatase